MANLKSALKRIRTNETKRLRNRNIKSNVRTHIKRVEQFVEANDVENAVASLRETKSAIDKAVNKGVFHKNFGERQKSRLAKKVNNITA